MALFKSFNMRKIYVLNQFWRTKKSTPAKMTDELREKLFQSYSAQYRNKSADVTEDVKSILRHDKFNEDDKITISDPINVDVISGVPEEHIKTRHVRIFMPAKSAMQSGTYGTRNWRIEFDQRERWENNLMGWSSTGDPLSNMSMDFDSSESAVAYCNSMGISYQIELPNKPILKPKSYGANFHWNKRSRVTTK